MNRLLTSSLLLALLLYCPAASPPHVPAGNIAAFGSTSSFTNPSDYSPYAWWQANSGDLTESDDTGVEDGDRIKSWPDQSGNNRHLVGPGGGGTSSLQYSTVNTINGLPTVSGGSATWMDVNFGATLSQPVTIYIVVRITALGTFAYWFDGLDVSNRIGGGKGNTDVPDMFANTTLADEDALANNTNYIFAFVFNTTSSEMWKNGTQVKTGAVGSHSVGGLTIGNLYGHANGGSHRLAEIIVYSGAHNSTQIGNVVGWLNTKWAVY